MLTLSNYLLDLYRVYVSGDEFRANVLKMLISTLIEPFRFRVIRAT